MIRALVFGGPKSKLRAVVAPFHGGVLQIYRDPVKDSRKVTDFDVSAWRPGLREVLERSFAAQAVAETVILSHGGGGSWEEALDLVSASLDAIEVTQGIGCRSAFVRFLWKWIDHLGVRLDPEECSECSCTPRSDEVVWYSRRRGSIECSACAEGGLGEDAVPLGPGARAWLRAVDRGAPLVALRVGADEASMRQARTFVLALGAEALGQRPNTWNFLEPS